MEKRSVKKGGIAAFFCCNLVPYMLLYIINKHISKQEKVMKDTEEQIKKIEKKYNSKLAKVREKSNKKIIKLSEKDYGNKQK